MDEDGVSPVEVPMTVGERLRAAREAAGMSLEEVATATRIPTRHLASLETSDFAKLPAPTYTIGFAKNYASAVGMDRSQIAADLRDEMGGTRPQTFEAETYEPADPARVMPKSLILGALAAIILVVLGFTWFNNRSLEADDEVVATEQINTTAPAPAAAAAQAAPVVTLTATAPVWLEVKDGLTTLKQGQMAAGESFVVPASAAAPVLNTAKPEALTIKVGDTIIPPVGPAGRRVTDVSLRAADLTKAQPAPAQSAQSSAPVPRPTAAPRRPAPTQRVAPAAQPTPAASTPPAAPVVEPQPVANSG